MESSEIHLPSIELSFEQNSKKVHSPQASVLRFNDIDKVASALGEFSDKVDNIPIVRYPDNNEISVVSTEQPYKFYYSDLEEQVHPKKKHFVRRKVLPEAQNDLDSTLNWTRPRWS